MSVSSPNITVRLIYREEQDEALSLIHQSVRALNTKDYTPNQVNQILRMYNRSLFKDGVVVVAMQNSRMIGVAKIDNGFWNTQCIQAVFTHPDFVRRGVGTALMQELERRADSKKTKNISIFASITGVEFYKSLGYRYNGQAEMHKGLPIALMDKQLRPFSLLEQVVSTGLVVAGAMIICFAVVSLSLIII